MLRRRRIAVVAAVVAAGVLTLPAGASARVSWLCRPGLTRNPCAPNLATTVFKPFDKKAGVIHPKRRTRRVDCFYVYPTVSDQAQTVASKAADPEVRDIALLQAARFSQLCRVYAPLYRQITVRGILRHDASGAQVRLGQADLTAAFRRYLRRDNKGRGIVFVGHSQGSARLIELLRRRVDKVPRVRERLVSAILLGGNVTVRKGERRGGVFSHIPACRRRTQTGCVIAFSTFDTTPPDDTLFGKGDNYFAAIFHQPRGAGLEVLCTNPAALRGGSAPLDFVEPTRAFAPGTLLRAAIDLLDLPLPSANTTFVASPDAFTGRCVTDNGARVLKVAPRSGTPTPKPSPDATWGLHLLDMNIAQGDLLRLLKSQIAAYRRR